MKNTIPYTPVKGKTYTLFGDSDHTSGYYESINWLAEECLKLEPDPEKIIQLIRNKSHKRFLLRRGLHQSRSNSLLTTLLKKADGILRPYTREVENHIKSLSLKNLWDRRLGTTREQYYLYMLEIFLVNRINKQAFLQCERKIALLPYCLQDFTTQCKAEPDDVDYRCQHCSKNCYQNRVTRMLEENNIDSFIWMESEFKKIYRTLKSGYNSLGILGIACVPELANGIHECARYTIPVVGIPLDANRCIRWWGEFFPNSVNLGELEKLIVNEGN